ncbi:uncharacterized protein CC84DRAFT_1161875, partial [Paraphaeosphaeria sporulosa]
STTEVIYLPPEANIGSEVPAGPGPRQDLQGVAHYIPPYSALLRARAGLSIRASRFTSLLWSYSLSQGETRSYTLGARRLY